MSIRDDFFASKAVGALWDVAVSIKRGNPLPLDSNSVFASYADLETYAAGVLAYPGQIVAVVNEDSTGIYYLDQELAIQEVGKIPSADNKSIEVADGVVSMHDYGKYYYKYIPAVEDETTGEIITPAEYQKTAVSDTDVWAAGLEPRVVSDDGELVIGWFEPNPTTVDGVQDQVVAVQTTVNDIDEQLNGDGGLVDQVENLQEEIGHAATETGDAATGLYAELEKKANAEDVYTKTEVDELLDDKANASDVYTKSETYTQDEVNTAIAAAVAGADHLKRIIVEDYDAIQTYINSHDDAERYIFMVPTAYVYTSESNKYDEYIAIKGLDEEGNAVYTIEPVGSWAVDLNDYVSETEFAEYLKQYYTQEQVNAILEAYSTTAEITTTLEKYYTIEQIGSLLEGYYTEEEINTLIASYYNKTETDNLLAEKVDKEEGKSLVSDDEIAKLATVEENAQENFIKSVTSDFEVSDEGQLSLKEITIAQVANLQDLLDSKVNTVYYAVENEDGSTSQVAGTLLSPTDQAKLNALVIGDEGIEISGTVNASNVEGLAEWITNNRDSVDGLFSAVEATKLEGIEEGAEKNYIRSVDPAEFNVDDTGHLTLVNAPLFTSISSDFVISESKELQLAESYVTTAIYTAEVGNLESLVRVTGNDSSTLVEEVNYINERLKWGELTE